MEKNYKKQSNLSRKLLYIVVPLFVLLLGWFGWMVKEKYFPPKPIHYHAGFIVVKDNKIVDFSAVKYMHEKPCTNKPASQKETMAEEQINKAHLHDRVGDVVHVHRAGAIWEDLFTNLNYPINYTDTEAYINGQKVTNFENLPIGHFDSLVVFIGKHNDVNKYLKQAVTKSHIEEIEQKSDNCGT